MNSSYYFIFVFAISLQCLSPTFATATCHPDDEAGLLAFKSGITQDPLGNLKDWKKGTKCCTWSGVICVTGDRVTSLRIRSSSIQDDDFLSGTISPSLSKLVHLEGIYLTYLKKITGSFPKFLFELPNLKFIDFTGNLLSGVIPPNIGELRRVEELILDDNQFTGVIPNSISSLNRLTWLSFRGNHISGTIPDIFTSLTNLGFIDFSKNQLSGNFPPSFAKLSQKLVHLEVNQNNLSGTIPNYFSRFIELATLDLSNNHFSGVVPKGFTNLPKIFNLKLSHNLLTGPFPFLKPVDGIAALDLSYNNFNLITIPEWVTSSELIYDLKLVKCGIKIILDNWKPKRAKYISYIDISENEISGSPTWFLNESVQLIEFHASGNKLRFDLGKLKFPESLKVLDLSRNLIFGKVPATVAGLEELNLSQNRLCGKLPVTKFPATAFGGNQCLCGSPLAPCKTLKRVMKQNL